MFFLKILRCQQDLDSIYQKLKGNYNTFKFIFKLNFSFDLKSSLMQLRKILNICFDFYREKIFLLCRSELKKESIGWIFSLLFISNEFFVCQQVHQFQWKVKEKKANLLRTNLETFLSKDSEFSKWKESFSTNFITIIFLSMESKSFFVVFFLTKEDLIRIF